MSRSDIKKPNVVPSRRSFLTGSAAALTGGAAVLASINDGARAAGQKRSSAGNDIRLLDIGLRHDFLLH